MKTILKKFITYLYTKYCFVEEIDQCILSNNQFRYDTLFYNSIAVDIRKVLEIYNYELSLVNGKNKISVELNSDIITVKFYGKNVLNWSTNDTTLSYDIAKIVGEDIFVSIDPKKKFYNLESGETDVINYSGKNLTKVVNELFNKKQIKTLMAKNNIFFKMV